MTIKIANQTTVMIYEVESEIAHVYSNTAYTFDVHTAYTTKTRYLQSNYKVSKRFRRTCNILRVISLEHHQQQRQQRQHQEWHLPYEPPCKPLPRMRAIEIRWYMI